MNWPRFSIAALLLVACGGNTTEDDDDGVGAASGLDRNERVVALDDTEMGELCDWISARLGGYGVSRDCEEGTASTTDNREECVASLQNYTPTTCEVTVGQYEDCANALNGDLCRLLSEPLCTSIVSCV